MTEHENTNPATGLAAALEARGITATAEPADANPHMDDAGPDARHWKVTMHYAGRALEVPFTQGPAWTTPPTAADVLACLLSEAAAIEEEPGFDGWAEALGLDTDSRKAEHTYRAVLAQTEALRAWVGPDDYEELAELAGG